MKDDVAEVVVDEDGNIIESETIERVKPVLEVLEDEGGEDDDDEDDDSEVEEDSDDDSEADDSDDEA
jgi:DNA gyrase subunit A